MEKTPIRKAYKPNFVANSYEWLLEWVLPGLFALILLGCLTHLGYCALQGPLLPAEGFSP